LKMSLLTEGGLGWMTSKDPFQPKAFYDSMVKWTHFHSETTVKSGLM